MIAFIASVQIRGTDDRGMSNRKENAVREDVSEGDKGVFWCVQVRMPKG